jgi:hypothetical protein
VTRRAATAAPSALLLATFLLATAACAGSTPAPRETPRPAAPAAASVREVTSDRGDRVLAPTPIGRLAPEDVPTTPAGRR